MKRVKGESDLYMRRSPPQMKNPESMKQLNASIEKLKKRHNLLNDPSKREFKTDISNYSSQKNDVNHVPGTNK